MNRHSHQYKFDSKISAGHTHRIMGYTENMVGIDAIHFHFFYGISSYNNHTHYYSGITGLPVKTENGHMHKIENVLEANCLHEHPITGFTFENISYIPRKSGKEAYI